jgi:rubrerythrin
MANYGVTNKSKLEEVKNKLRESRLKNNNAKIAAEKSRKTRFEKNNGLWHDKDFGNKVKISKIKNGHSAGWNNIEKRKNTLIDKYGVNNTFCLPQVRKASFNALMKKSYEEHILKCKFDEPLFTFDEYLNRINDGQIFKFKCRKCGTVFESSHHDGYHKKCPICYPKLDGISLEEIEFGNMIKSFLLNEEIIIGSRNIIPPMELDIYIPEKKLAFEFDGLFWHSDANNNITKNYHLNKTELCEK